MPNMKKAFSLVELSVVFSVIGLLVAAITAGSHLIYNSKVRNFVSQFNKIQTAVQTFKLNYKALPGDFKDAQSFFTASLCPNNTNSSVNCDGDGDGYLENGENTYVFKHLSLAQMFQGNFSPETVNPTNNYMPSSANSDPFSISAEQTGLFSFWEHVSANLQYQIYFAKVRTTSDGNFEKPVESVFDGKTAITIDRKIDDGVFSTGNLIITTGVETTGCTSETSDVKCYGYWKESKF